MQEDAVAKKLAELFLLLAQIDAADETDDTDETDANDTTDSPGQADSDSPNPATPANPDAQTLEQTLGECPICGAFVRANETVQNPLTTIYLGDCHSCGVAVMWLPEVPISLARTATGDLVLLDKEVVSVTNETDVAQETTQEEAQDAT